jgi:hypothetical protein
MVFFGMVHLDQEAYKYVSLSHPFAEGKPKHISEIALETTSIPCSESEKHFNSLLRVRETSRSEWIPKG